jgi:Tfp pilus assembly protein PilN
LPRQWTALAAALAICVLAFPYAEALLFKGHLTRRLNQIQAEEARLGTLDHELSFFQFLRKTQPPALDLLSLIVQAAPPGTSFESWSLTRAGELSLRGKLGNGTEVTDFRTKLMQSGWFDSVVVDEQTQQPDRRVSVRVTAMLKPADLRRPLAAAPEKKDGKGEKT